MKKASYVLKGKVKKLLSLLLVLAMALSLAGLPVFAAEDTDTTPTPELSLELGDMTGKLVIIHTNDTHGADVAVPGVSLGTAGIARIVKDYEDAGAEVLLISAGDAIQGDPLVNLSKGETAIKFMKLAGYDLIVPGNHEFDFGFDNLMKLEVLADFPIISANILDKKSGEAVFDENIIFDTK
ncbi:MAG TPA: multifunctional 2',3'-cyclic-nucleotide 2'-phosphodiesterase/5'-nucleotidase/3'-nucleotidase, partial [Clostridiales bacterium]|nr:multifunctional 2',3'-cyclic-nucleotide 2'-phosphodiesterase/5'-nucleotidase/3'-nucleotidase [Clostridiales bacterium]